MALNNDVYVTGRCRGCWYGVGVPRSSRSLLLASSPERRSSEAPLAWPLPCSPAHRGEGLQPCSEPLPRGHRGRCHKTDGGEDQAEQPCKVLPCDKQALLSGFGFCLQSQRPRFLQTALQKCAKPSRGRHQRSLGRTEPDSGPAFSTVPQRLTPRAQDSPAEPLLGSQRRRQHGPALAALDRTAGSCSWSGAATCRQPGSGQGPEAAQGFLCPAQDGGRGDGGRDMQAPGKPFDLLPGRLLYQFFIHGPEGIHNTSPHTLLHAPWPPHLSQKGKRDGSCTPL